MKKIIIALLLILALSTPSLATTVEWPLTFASGSGSINNYGSLRLSDYGGGGNQVLVEGQYNSSLLSPGNNFGIQHMYFTVNNIPDPTTAITLSNVSGGATLSVVSPNGVPANMGLFNIEVSGTGSNRVVPGANTYASLFVLNGAGLDVSDFVNNAYGFYALVHLGGIALDPNNPEITYSDKFGATPIPGTVYLFGSGLAGLVGIGRWRRRK